MSDIDGLEMKTRVDEILNRHPALGFALGVVRNGSLEFFHTHGLADLASNRPVAEDTVFRVASITKTFTAIAVMQLWEQGLIELDAPANDYLRAYQLIPANTSWRPATVRHLLTHTAGIPEQVPRSGIFRTDFGESVKLGRPVPSLADYYRGGLGLNAEPGTMFRYGDHGPATLGQIVEDVSGTSLNRYLREHVFEPLGMADTTLLRSEVVQSRLATGYKLSSTGPKPVTDREVVTAGAGGIYSTPKDMARYLAALLGGGANEHGTRAQTRDACQHVRRPIPAPSPDTGHGTGVLAPHRRRAPRGRAPGHHPWIRLPNPGGPRRRTRADGLHQRGQPRGAVDAG